MPLDPEPSEEGNVVILGELARVLAAGETGEPRFLSHFATCPNAAQHRKPKP
jgi:hypothetical protein